ncbi:glutaredoxin family protein [Streptomyces sp. NPDC059740]|uniref:glutaredoxin family protein n=1 Tax=Streptomyces sp. NPDC059740 TaxID=3346926 RepID=UPI003669815D
MAPLLRRNRRGDPADRMVTLIGKPDCHLCEDAEAVVAQVCAETGASWEKKDITQDAELHRAYWEQIPVVLVDGAQHDFWRVNPDRLRRALGA